MLPDSHRDSLKRQILINNAMLAPLESGQSRIWSRGPNGSMINETEKQIRHLKQSQIA
jgi:hypothetical protein